MASHEKRELWGWTSETLRLRKHREMQRSLPCGSSPSRDHQHISIVLRVLQYLCQACLSLCSRMFPLECNGCYRQRWQEDKLCAPVTSAKNLCPLMAPRLADFTRLSARASFSAVVDSVLSWVRGRSYCLNDAPAMQHVQASSTHLIMTAGMLGDWGQQVKLVDFAPFVCKACFS